MSSSPVDRMSGASTPTLLAMSSLASNRLHDELTGLKRWRQMYDSAMNEKNEELQKLQLINQRQTQTIDDSIVQIEQQTVTISSMKQNELLLAKKVTKLEELHHILKKNVAKLEKTVSQCEFVRVDLERMYEHQERNVKTLTERVDSTIETKLQNIQSQLKLMEQLHEQARMELNRQIQERTHDNAEANNQILELRKIIATAENEMHQLQFVNGNAQTKINELTEEINKAQHFIETLLIGHNTELTTKIQEIEALNKRIETFVLKIDSHKEEIFNLQESNQVLQHRLNEMQQKTVEHTEYHETEVQARQAEIHVREKENEQLKVANAQLSEQMVTCNREIGELKEKNTVLHKEISTTNSNLQTQLNETCEQYQRQIGDYAKQSIEYDNRMEQQTAELNEKDRIFKDLKSKFDELTEKMDLTEEEINQMNKENEDLRAQYQALLQETDERTEQIKQKDVIVEATNIEIGEKDREIEELKSKVTSLEERLSKNQNLLTSLRSSMGEKDAKIKRLEQGPLISQLSSPLAARSATVRRTGISHPLAVNQTKSTASMRSAVQPPMATSQQTKVYTREKRMLPPPSEMTSTPKKIIRLSQTKAAMDQAHALEKSISPLIDDDRDEVASNTSVASLFEYLKKI